MLTIPGGTHAATIEQPELIELRLERFLARLPRVAGAPAQKAGEKAQEQAGKPAQLHSVAG